MFEKLEIWERGTDKTTIYLVFRHLETGLHHVQQANVLQHGASLQDVREAMATHRHYAADLFNDQSPAERSRGYGTVKEAVEMHKSAFAEILA
ncbi:MAG: hypothetical protein JWM58_950 [Rhizobium sp.]|nr:hypothetical protein [Rhizobium sp.]